MPWKLKDSNEHSLLVQVWHDEPGGDEGRQVLDNDREWRVIKNVRLPSGRWMIVFSGYLFFTDDAFLKNVGIVAVNAVMSRWGTRDCGVLRVESLNIGAKTVYLTNAPL